jgi:hypothetical protein
MTDKLAERFWAKVDAGGGPAACWLWTASIFRSGYGQYTVDRRKEGGVLSSYAHRFSYELSTGQPIPEGLLVLHSCDVKACVNPTHLRLGTAADNARDKISRGRARPPRGEAHHRARLTELAVLEIKDKYLHGATTHALAREYGVTPASIQGALVGRTWQHMGMTRDAAYVAASATHRSMGERQHMAKLAAVSVRDIRCSYAEGGCSFRDLARRHGVSIGAIQGVLSGKTWKHVT